MFITRKLPDNALMGERRLHRYIYTKDRPRRRRPRGGPIRTDRKGKYMPSARTARHCRVDRTVQRELYTPRAGR
jgi:hypothetical protein